MFQIPLLQQQPVRDLAWAIFAPNLIDDYHFHPQGEGIQSCRMPLTRQRTAWLQSLDQDSSPLLAALSQRKSTRLGIYFECLWQFFISSEPELTLLAANLPVYRHKTTLGEFDLLYRNNITEEIIHLELATKYYLNTLTSQSAPSGNHPALSNWLGPNTKDRLDKKLQRLLSHQTRLDELNEGQELLKEKDWYPVQSSIALKGFLFDRGIGESACRQAPLSPEGNRGSWLTISQLPELAQQTEHWFILQRPRWISPARVAESESHQILSAQSLVKHLSVHFQQPEPRPVMLCAMHTQGNFLKESARYMVTHNEWPHPPNHSQTD